MNELHPHTVHQFFKRFQLRGGRIQRVILRTRTDGSSAEVRLTARDIGADRVVRLRLACDGLEEYRFQRRPGSGLERLKEVRVGFFGPLVYMNFDAYPEDGPPKVMDFRASDCFLAGKIVRWEVLERHAAF